MCVCAGLNVKCLLECLTSLQGNYRWTVSSLVHENMKMKRREGLHISIILFSVNLPVMCLIVKYQKNVKYAQYNCQD